MTTVPNIRRQVRQHSDVAVGSTDERARTEGAEKGLVVDADNN
jgi:hypothetical protein